MTAGAQIGSAQPFDLLGLSRELRDLIYNYMIGQAIDEERLRCDTTCCKHTFQEEYGVDPNENELSFEQDKYECLEEKRHYTRPLTIH